MNKKQLLILLILSIFIIGMICGAASASHTFKVGKYKATVSDKKYNKMKTDAKKGKYVCTYLKTGKYKTYKEPKYKTVKTKVWKHKTVCYSKLVFSDDWSDSNSYDYDISKYWKSWKWCGSKTKTSKDGHTIKYYEKFKKKVTKKVKVKKGYKKVKKPIYITVSNSDETGKLSKNVYAIDLWTEYERL